ncbi:stage III sporulation protein AE [Roseburia sp. 499]|uniref:stage III sporulation protein AE n=1 Tax=Roseburia sp. 499 TaxID=1261634 RepID=UPI000952F606|nr:stage III sporulation protein AE [Roseburia sp. 499]WVK71101.1 stage III sporulation protein AE [Roseburia sp. 499]
MKKWIIGIVLALMLGGNSLTVYAMSDIAENETIEEYFDELDFDEVDKVLEEKGTGITFRELVQMLIDGEKIDKGELLRNLLDVVFHEVLSFRLELLQIVLLCIVFSILYNFTNIFENPAVTQISFYMVYMLLMVLLLKSFWVLKDVVLAVLDDMLVFLKLLVPTFSLSMVFSGQMTAGSVFYELTFLLIYGIEWLMNGVIVPAIQIYVVVEMMNYLTEEEMLSKMTELLKEGIEWVLKLVFTTVIGINVVQNLLAPVIDGFKSTLISRTAGMIPGLGTSINAVTEIMVGSGIIIKNGVGVAAILVLVVLCAGSVIKVWVMTFLYRLVGAVMQPIADKRMLGCISGTGEGGRLLGKVTVTTVVMFLVTIAMVTAATTFR